MMEMLARLIARLRGLTRRRAIDAELDEELQFHLEHEIDANIARGMPPVEARRIALRDLGGIAQTQESVRDVRRLALDLIWRDTRHAVRALCAAPGFSAIALVILTLSIGATTAIFSVVDAVVLRGLPFDESDRLVAVGEQNIKDPSNDPQNRVAPQNFLDWRAQQDVFAGLAAVNEARFSFKREGDGEPETLRSQMVTAEFFHVLRVTPFIGRPFTQENEVNGRGRVAVISYSLWQRRFGGAPDILRKPLRGVLADLEIVGVMPPGFVYPVGASEPAQLWMPFAFADEDRIRGNSFGYNLQVIGRLRDGVSLERAQARMDQITAGLAAETPRWFADRVAKVEPLHQYVTRGVRTWMLMLLGAVAFVLLIACVNLANLMLVRATARARELGIRSALGASRWDLARALLIESLMLSLLGAALGIGVAALGVDVLRSAMPAEVPRIAAIAVDLRVLAVTALVAIATGMIFGTAPVLQFSRVTDSGVLNQRERASTADTGAQRLRSVLVVSQVALAVILLVGSGLFLASFARVTSVDLGVNHRDVLTVHIRPLVGQKEAYGDAVMSLETARQRNPQRLHTILERVRTIPGVEIASLADGGIPLRGDLRTANFGIPGRTLPKNADIDLNQISPDYFKALDVPLLKGRIFTDTDRQNNQAVVIFNEAAARKYFGDEDAIGKLVQVAGTREIVGLVGNIRHDGPESDWRTQAFIPLAQSRSIGASLVLRTTGDMATILPAVRAAVWSEFPNLPIPDIHTLEQLLSRLLAERRFNMLLLGLFGVLGILIAAIGIYGVMAYTVAQRTQEIGIRMALGALPGTILRSVLAQASMYLTFGIAIGIAGAWTLAGLVEGFLFEIEPHDPLVYVSVFVVLALTGLAAALLPAQRAARVDPLVALRVD
jgi:putative ABC transport system permease protein